MGNQVNTGNYNPKRLEEMIGVCKEYGLKSKEHNGDYLTQKDYKDRFDIGLDSINIPVSLVKSKLNVILRRWEKISKNIFKYVLIPKDGRSGLIVSLNLNNKKN